ncbi:hypothetical protein HYPSUDRAFT_64718 [Hypholoma sublateritium FD-334 SS-4]|uniref:Tail specific protease domain-containing protein n=1 Tax=Hypholoma sublateritium (strain FD-334 SS-4) TaxID=945553 RepID=A0A0D2Q1V9_HYPSF|nr:hypothetical protein HYPSUDRAFT_64718 [Hypholoma sublateritium FD-334 SS-4]
MRFSKPLRAALIAFVAASVAVSATIDVPDHSVDPCAAIGDKKWVSPREVRACYSSFKVNGAIKTNILDVAEKTAAFHTSVNYQIKAPAPFTSEVHENLMQDISRIRRQNYASEYDFHIDLSRTFKRLNDGHCSWTNYCYVSLFVNYLPTPLVLLTAADGTQNVHIAYEAFTVASAEFPDQISVWQDALPLGLKGKLETLSGAKVLLINGKLPFDAVNANAAIAGGYQALGARQNVYFSSYRRVAGEWGYVFGQFAQQALPLDDYAVLTIQRVNHTLLDTIVLPYRSRLGSAAVPFQDTVSWRANNCAAVASTNGVDYYSSKVPDTSAAKLAPAGPKHLLNVAADNSPLTDVTLPAILQPTLVPLEGSRNVAQFYLARDGKTGVLALGSFSDTNYSAFLSSLLTGLQSLTKLGATQLIVDVTNNGGGFICAAQWLHRIIAGPKSTTVPQAGFDTTARAGPLAQLIVQSVVTNSTDPSQNLLYNPVNWRDASNNFFAVDNNWLEPPVDFVINGRKDSFSQRLGQECQPEGFPDDAPAEALFDTKKVAIVSNGRCASSCSLFSIAMSKLEGSKTVVVGGKADVGQKYCGTIGGQSTDFVTIDSEIKTTGLKNHTLAPPDMIVNGVLGITWRLAYGVDKPNEPAEWQDHAANLNLPLTANLVNNPVAIWEEVARRVF